MRRRNSLNVLASAITPRSVRVRACPNASDLGLPLDLFTSATLWLQRKSLVPLCASSADGDEAIGEAFLVPLAHGKLLQSCALAHEPVFPGALPGFWAALSRLLWVAAGCHQPALVSGGTARCLRPGHIEGHFGRT